MAVWWMTEAVPLAITALLPLILFPFLNIQSLGEAAPSYAHPLIFLFLGGFLLARAINVWGLDRRLALIVLRIVGLQPRNVIAGIMAVTAFLSMWVSNTATAMVMLPIGQSILAALDQHESDATYVNQGHMAPALLLGIAYAATIGGMGTIIGTPPNALFVAFMQTSQGVEISFVRWMLIGIPLVLILLPLCWIVLTRIAFQVPYQTTVLQWGRLEMGFGKIAPISTPEKRVALISTLVACGWIFRPLLSAYVPGLPLTDTTIALTGAVMLFLIPAEFKSGRFLLNWNDAANIRWDVLILFGGGLTLANAISQTDLANWLGGQFMGPQYFPLFLSILAVGTLIVIVGELASNTAMAAVFLPVAAATALGMNEPVITFALPVALFATLGFMLPVATPPNAIIFGSGLVKMTHMLRAGWMLNVLGIVVVSCIVLILGDAVFGSP